MSPTECQYKALKGLVTADNWGQDCTNLSETPRQKQKPKSFEKPAVPGSMKEPPGPFLTKAPQGLLPADP